MVNRTNRVHNPIRVRHDRERYWRTGYGREVGGVNDMNALKSRRPAQDIRAEHSVVTAHWKTSTGVETAPRQYDLGAAWGNHAKRGKAPS